MNRISLIPSVALACGVIVVGGTNAAFAQQYVNPIHPAFPLFDQEGALVLESGQPFSSEKSCGACHDVDYIDKHSSHPTSRVDVDCVDCHIVGQKLDQDPWKLDERGWVKRESIRIGGPRSEHCGSCHGLVHSDVKPLIIPEDLVKTGFSDEISSYYSITLGTGAIISWQKIADSFLNIRGKEELSVPWDVHAARLVECRECHFASNNPEHTARKRDEMPFLRFDPRRVTIAEYLTRPDHRLPKSDCRACHEPIAVHDFLPFKARHLRTLSCQACHIPELRGPAYQMIDETVVLPDGGPGREFRALRQESDQPLAAAYINGFRPLLAPTRGADGLERFAPYNLVTRWAWVSASNKRRVPSELVKKAFFERTGYAPAVVKLLDIDRDGKLERDELSLDTPDKVAGITERLISLGVIDPRIEGVVETIAVAHGVMEKEEVQRDCDACHGEHSRLVEIFPLSSYKPHGASVRWKKSPSVIVEGRFTSLPEHALAYLPAQSPLGFHIFGLSRQDATNKLGLGLFFLVFLGCLLHGVVRVVNRRRAVKKQKSAERAYVYSIYDRVWHWIMALCGVVLLVTGFKIHLGPAWSWFDMAAAVTTHNWAALALMANAFLTLFYHLTTNTLQKYIPAASNLLERILRQLDYYLRGIFRGASNPMVKTPKRRLNPLQQLTYLALFSLLLPWQIVTGVLIWGASRWPGVDAFLGGLTVVAPLHNLGSWLFLCFFVLHHYLITTGASVGAELKTMITGYDHFEKG
ncbi:MAG: cytochrome b/b6 domain-containing protein [Deltaproteobacteria bacterium]|nr:cytochrome b/b6 domain-containing protein [Deltaproteobacteria bacterium]